MRTAKKVVWDGAMLFAVVLLGACSGVTTAEQANAIREREAPGAKVITGHSTENGTYSWLLERNDHYLLLTIDGKRQVSKMVVEKVQVCGSPAAQLGDQLMDAGAAAAEKAKKAGKSLGDWLSEKLSDKPAPEKK